MAAFIKENTVFQGIDGKPLVNGKLYIGSKGNDPKTNLISIFSDRELTSALANPQILDAFGASTNKIWIPGQYSMQVDNSNDVQKFIDLDAGETPESGITTLGNVQGTNTITAEATATITSYVDKELYTFTVGTTNTDVVTLNIDGVGAATIVKNGGAQIGSGDFVVGNNIIVSRNNTNSNFEWVNSIIAENTGNNILVLHETLVCKFVTASTVDIDATAVLLKDVNGNPYRAKSVNLTLDVSTTGANGRDILENSGNESTSEWYFLWVIFNGSTVASFATINFSSGLLNFPADLPSGYTHAGLVGAVFNNSGSDFDDFHQVGNRVATIRTIVVANGAATSPTAVALTAVIPDVAKSIVGTLEANDTMLMEATIRVFSNSAGTLGESQHRTRNTTGNNESSPFVLTVTALQTIWYNMLDSDERGTVIITGWEY